MRRLVHVPPLPDSDAVAFVKARKIHRRGIGWIDAHLPGSALVAGVQFWTADGPLDSVANELGIAYRP